MIAPLTADFVVTDPHIGDREFDRVESDAIQAVHDAGGGSVTLAYFDAESANEEDETGWVIRTYVADEDGVVDYTSDVQTC